eukprot:2867808-Pyramimonas_sp.AAC.1
MVSVPHLNTPLLLRLPAAITAVTGSRPDSPPESAHALFNCRSFLRSNHHGRVQVWPRAYLFNHFSRAIFTSL